MPWPCAAATDVSQVKKITAHYLSGRGRLLETRELALGTKCSLKVVTNESKTSAPPAKPGATPATAAPQMAGKLINLTAEQCEKFKKDFARPLAGDLPKFPAQVVPDYSYADLSIESKGEKKKTLVRAERYLECDSDLKCKPPQLSPTEEMALQIKELGEEKESKKK